MTDPRPRKLYAQKEEQQKPQQPGVSLVIEGLQVPADMVIEAIAELQQAFMDHAKLLSDVLAAGTATATAVERQNALIEKQNELLARQNEIALAPTIPVREGDKIVSAQKQLKKQAAVVDSGDGNAGGAT